jgi:hypothetical protein
MVLENIVEKAKLPTGVVFALLGIAMAAFGADVLATHGSNATHLLNEALGPQKVDRDALRGMFKWTESIPRKIDLPNFMGAPIALAGGATLWKGSDLMRGK